MIAGRALGSGLDRMKPGNQSHPVASGKAVNELTQNSGGPCAPHRPAKPRCGVGLWGARFPTFLRNIVWHFLERNSTILLSCVQDWAIVRCKFPLTRGCQSQRKRKYQARGFNWRREPQRNRGTVWTDSAGTCFRSPLVLRTPATSCRRHPPITWRSMPLR